MISEEGKPAWVGRRRSANRLAMQRHEAKSSIRGEIHALLMVAEGWCDSLGDWINRKSVQSIESEGYGTGRAVIQEESSRAAPDERVMFDPG